MLCLESFEQRGPFFDMQRRVSPRKATWQSRRERVRSGRNRFKTASGN